MNARQNQTEGPRAVQTDQPPRLEQPKRPKRCVHSMTDHEMVVENDPERIERVAQSTCPRRRVTASGRRTDDYAQGSRRRH